MHDMWQGVLVLNGLKKEPKQSEAIPFREPCLRSTHIPLRIRLLARDRRSTKQRASQMGSSQSDPAWHHARGCLTHSSGGK